jgi:hypothetical protein
VLAVSKPCGIETHSDSHVISLCAEPINLEHRCITRRVDARATELERGRARQDPGRVFAIGGQRRDELDHDWPVVRAWLLVDGRRGGHVRRLRRCLKG